MAIPISPWLQFDAQSHESSLSVVQIDVENEATERQNEAHGLPNEANDGRNEANALTMV
jgi:hypothetical protein